MQNHPQPPYPRPDIVNADFPSRPLPSHSTSRTTNYAAPHPYRSPSVDLEFLIVNLSALRITEHLIQTLPSYHHRAADLTWLATFLSGYDTAYALAKTTGRTRDDYMTSYPQIVARMKTQSKYPVRFMELLPAGARAGERDQVQGQGQRQREAESECSMSDDQRLAIIDFCDAAAEWGSMVPIPAREAQRMVELAGRRRVADLDTLHAAPRSEARRGEFGRDGVRDGGRGTGGSRADVRGFGGRV